jgi:hypothetical protein
LPNLNEKPVEIGYLGRALSCTGTYKTGPAAARGGVFAGALGKCAALSSSFARLQDYLSNPTFLTESVRLGGLSQRHSAADG